VEKMLELVANDVKTAMDHGEGCFISLVHKKLREHNVKTTSDDRGIIIHCISGIITKQGGN